MKQPVKIAEMTDYFPYTADKVSPKLLFCGTNALTHDFCAFSPYHDRKSALTGELGTLVSLFAESVFVQ